MKYFFRLVYLLVFLFLTFSSYGQQGEDYPIKIDSLLKTSSSRPFNGVVLVSQNGKTVYSKAYGYANFDKKTPIRLDDQFEIMSNGKQITAVLILREVEKGKIALDSPIKKYLSYLTQSWADSVTVHQLLNHSHGIVDIEKPLLFKAGSEYKYGNLSYNLLGKIIEYATKKTYAEVAAELFKTLKMQNTFCYLKGETKNLVKGYINKENSFKAVENTQINDENLPSDGVITTAKDLAIWNNKLHRGKLLRPETYKLFSSKTIMAQHDVFGKDKVGYGYGIRISDKTPVKYIGHTGLGDGFASVNLYFPQSGVSLIVLENQMNVNMDIGYYFGIEIKKILLKSNLLNRN